jgi:hypothetical protein
MIYIADNYSKSQMIGLGIAFIILPVIAVSFRIWAKSLGRRTISWDDYLILVALVGHSRPSKEFPKSDDGQGICHWLLFNAASR